MPSRMFVMPRLMDFPLRDQGPGTGQLSLSLPCTDELIFVLSAPLLY